MHRPRTALLAVATLAVGTAVAAGCGSDGNPAPTTAPITVSGTLASPGSTPGTVPGTTPGTAARGTSPGTTPGTAPAGTALAVPAVTVPGEIGTVPPGEVPEATRDLLLGLQGVDDTQRGCIEFVSWSTASANPDQAGDPGWQAGVAGAAAVACLGPEQAGAALAATVRASEQGAGLTSSELACVDETLRGIDAERLARFLAYAVWRNAEAQGAARALLAATVDQVCGTTFGEG